MSVVDEISMVVTDRGRKLLEPEIQALLDRARLLGISHRYTRHADSIAEALKCEGLPDVVSNTV